MSRKAGVATPEELRAFVQQAGDTLRVIDVRNPDATVEPGDQKFRRSGITLHILSTPSCPSTMGSRQEYHASTRST